MSPSRSQLLSTLGAAVATIALTCAPSTGAAASNDDVAVLPAAGTDVADVYSLTGTPNNLQAERIGQRRLIHESLGPSSFADFKILPADGHLLADFEDRGFATTDSTGALEVSLAPRGERPGIKSASVVGFDSSAQPERFLYTDDDNQRVGIHDARAETDIWSKQLVSPPVPANIVQAIALPDNRLAVARNWPTLQAGGIDILDLDAASPGEIRVRFASKSHNGAPNNTKLVDGLTGLSDLFGLDEDRLLVTGHDHLFVLSISEREVLHRLDLSERDELAGRFVAARGLPSGRIAAATVEPGLWTRPHENHRVVWFDDQLETLIARTDPISRAPWRIDAADGHGGSGTLGLEPDLSFVPTGGLDDVRLDGPMTIRPAPARQGGTGEASAAVVNQTTHPIVLERLALTASPGDCEQGADRTTFVEQFHLLLPASEPTTIESAFSLDPEAPTGDWCARLELENRDGDSRVESQEAAFSVIADGGDVGRRTGRNVEPVDLNLRTDDVGTGDPSDDGPITDLPTDPVGCGCHPVRNRAPAWPALLTVALAGWILRRRRR